MSSRRALTRAVFVLVSMAVPVVAAAEEKNAPPKPPPDESPGLAAQIFGTFAFGKGLRFNNPFRLATEFGDDAESVSATAAYVDFGANMSFGSPRGLQHGGAIHAGVSVEGVSQAFLSFSYELVYRRHADWMFHARGGPILLLSPDVNTGGELAAGFSYFFTGGIGVTSELAFDLFYGASTLDKTYTVFPTLSGQLGVIVDFEVLP